VTSQTSRDQARADRERPTTISINIRIQTLIMRGLDATDAREQALAEGYTR
jgi:hypothetical protein